MSADRRTGMKKLIILSAMVVALLFSQTAMADLVVNGDFEATDSPYYSWTGWTKDDGCYETVWYGVNHTAALAYLPGTFSQTISTTPGTSYTFSFVLAHDSSGGTQVLPPLPLYPPTQDFQASWNGSPVLSFVLPTPNILPWTPYTFTVEATGSSSTISFAGQDTGGYYWVDNVSVIPEPASMLLFGPGLVGLAAVRRRFKK
jgi:hypothetical protein